jgi:Flp pilus assembly protein TadD
MLPRRARPATSLFALLLASAAALTLPGCTPQDSRSDVVPRLSDLGQKNDRKASMLKLGDAARQGGDCEAAIRFYRMVKDRDGNHVASAAARIGTADCELALGSLADAARDYRLAAGLSPQDPTPSIGLGRIALVDHKPAAAGSYFDQAIEKGAEAPFVWNDRGVADDQLRQHKEAQAAYRQGLAKYPDDRALRNNLALSLAMTGDFTEAETLLQALVAEPGATARTRENLALVLGLEGKLAEARQVAQNDLDGAALDNNSRFYQYARALITGAPLPSPTAALDSSASSAALAAAQADAAPVPPPVLVADQPLHGLRAAEPPSFEDETPTVAKTELPAPPATAMAQPAQDEAHAATSAPSQTAALPSAIGDGGAANPAAPAEAGTPTRIVGAGGGPLVKDPDADPVASSENH